jgi:hypothetical protein
MMRSGMSVRAALKLSIRISPEEIVSIIEDAAYAGRERNKWALQPPTLLFLKEVIRKTRQKAETLLETGAAMSEAMDEITIALEGGKTNG